MYPYTYEELHRIANSDKGRPIIEKAKRIYEEKYEKNPTLALKYSLYKLYFETGDRTEFETMYFERRKRLALLQLLAFRDDSYLAPLEDILAAICDEFCWILPAHVYMHPDIDLFSAETSFYLTECDYIFGDKLSEELRRRIRRSVMEKTILPFEERRCLWETRSNNWSAVCAAGIGLACLYLFPERFPTIEKRIFDAFSVYLETIGDDGYCEEGIAYWQYGFGFFSIFFDVYTAITEKRPDILKLKKVCGLVKYAANAQLDGNVFLPYADGGTKLYYEDPGVLFAVKSLFSELFDYDLSKCVIFFS